MKQKKAVIVVGMSRGGTNITWNILQSHPQLGAPIKELGQEVNITTDNRMRTVLDMALGSPFVSQTPLKNLVANWLENRLYRSKMSGLADTYARQKSEDEIYTSDELAQAALLLKSTDRDMYLMDLLHQIYPDLYIITLVRNGFAVCESWIRRGHSAEKAGKRYRHYVGTMLDMHDKYDNCLLVRFEDVLHEPFTQAEIMFSFAKLEPISLEKLRLKIKRVVNKSGEHETPFGGEGGKAWFTRENIGDLLIADQSDVQYQRLTEVDRNMFLKYSGAIMERLGYN